MLKPATVAADSLNWGTAVQTLRVELVCEPSNRHGPLAAATMTASGTCVGHLSRERAGWIALKIDGGYPGNAIVQRVKGAHLPDDVVRLVVRVNMEGEKPELAA